MSLEIPEMPLNNATDENGYDSTIMDMDGGDGSDGKGVVDTETNTISTQKLSCDRCRLRKVRCDRGDPCVPCTRKQVKCTYTTGYKQRERRQKTYLSNSYEEKIEDISNKLDRICSLMNTVAASPGSAQPKLLAQVASVSSSDGPSPSSRIEAADASESELEGELSLTAHAAFATEFVEQAVSNNRTIPVTPEMTSSLNALRKIVDTNSTSRHNAKAQNSQPQHVATSDTVGGIQMPPLHSAFACLGILKETPKIRYMWSYEIDSVGQFMEYFLTVYSGKPTNADLIIVNCGLYRLFQECSVVETDPSLKADYKAHAGLCRQNLESVLTRLPFILPSTIHYILALCMGSIHYMDEGKPTLAWSIIVAAGHMCVSLGLNRDTPLEPETLEARRRRIRVFWAVCLTEKSLALRLGRPSTIRNNEITVPKTVDDGVLPEGGMVPILPKWIDMVLLQDRVYDDIYSPSALSQPDEVRITRARSLAAEMQSTFEALNQLEKRYEVMFRETLGGPAFEAFYQAEKVCYLAVLTLIYRSIPPSPYSGSAFGEECIATAMHALDEHEKCISSLHDDQSDNVLSLYIEWGLLSAPFVPFIVIFCHVIETSSPAYLSKLASLVGALRAVAPDLPGAYGKQCAIFTLMYEVACKYVEARGPAGAAGAGAGPAPVQQHAAVSAEEFDDLFGDAGIIGAQLRSPILRFSEAGSRQQQQQQQQQQAFGLDQGGAAGGGGDAETAAERAAAVENLGNWFDQNHQIFRMMDDAEF